MKPEWWTAIKKGIEFLAAQQQPDGSFTHYMSRTKKPFKPVAGNQTVLLPALILGALASIEDDEAQTIRNKLAAWLIKQKSPEWSFNYWARNATAPPATSRPDDLHSTFCALIALQQHNPQLIDSACLAKMVRLLIATESQVGGPYHTWLATKNFPSPQQKVETVVNSQIAYFLQQVASAPPPLTNYLQDSVLTDAYALPNYLLWQMSAYYLSRVSTGAAGDKLADRLTARQENGTWETPLATALASLSLLQLGRPMGLDSAIAYLVATQLPNGSWPAEAFYHDPLQHAQKSFAGSAMLTTAFAIEALARYKPLVAASPAKSALKQERTPTQKIYNDVIQMARTQFNQLKPPLQVAALTMLERMNNSPHTQEIVLLPLLFANSLRSTPSLPPGLIAHLGLANLYGWMAYTIYDDFLDDEGNPQLLSVANVALRYSLASFKDALPQHAGFQKKVLATFDTIDEANAWEVTYCRAVIHDDTIRMPAPLPAYNKVLQLAERSLGHALTPFGILASQGVDLESTAALHIETAFKHYLAARQLNDDLHDWRQDLQAGQCTYVVTKIYKALHTRARAQPLTQLIPIMQQQFWNDTLLPVCKTMTRNTQLARQAANDSQLLTASSIITKLTRDIDTSIRLTHTEHAKATMFLMAYRSH